MTSRWIRLVGILVFAAPVPGQYQQTGPKTQGVRTPYVAPPGAAITVQINGNNFVVSWVDNAEGEFGYEIQASSDGWASHLSFTVGANYESCVVSGLTTSTTYEWKVRAIPQGFGGSVPPGTCLQQGTGPWVCPAGGPIMTTPGQVPSAPANASAPGSGVGSSSVAIQWQDTSTNEFGFELLRLDPGENPTEWIDWDLAAAYQPPNTTACIASGLLPGTTYRFKIRAFNPDGRSDDSNTIVTTTTASLPGPTGLVVVEARAHQVDLAWQDHAIDETAYRIDMLPPGADPSDPVAWNNYGGDQPPNTTAFTPAGLLEGEEYRFKVRAKNAALPPPSGPIYSAYSNVVIFVTPPGTPSNLAATAMGLDYVDLAWQNHGSTATAVRVSILPPGANANDPAAWNNIGGDLSPSTTTYTASGLQAGAQYSFRVREQNDSVSPTVSSPYSDPITVTTPGPLATPTSVSISAVGPDWITVSWQDNAVGETNYRLDKLPPGGDPSNPVDWNSVDGNLPANTTSHTATGLDVNATYRFKVRCSNVSVTPTLFSNYSGTVIGSTLCPLSAAPSGLHTTAITDTCVTLNWTDIATDETAYRVDLLPPGGDPSNPVDWNNTGGNLPPNTTGYTKTGLTTGGSYKFKVRCQNACGWGSYSNIVTVTVSEQRPPAPTNCIANRNGAPQGGGIHPIYVNWDYGGNPIDGFRVARLDPGEDPNNAAAWDNYGGDLLPTARQYINNTNLIDEQTYTYKVRAYRITPCGRINSDYSNTDTAIP